jgi:hypothetical protein
MHPSFLMSRWMSSPGFYDEVDGELRAHHRGIALLERWLGRRLCRGDLEARDNSANSEQLRPLRAEACLYLARHQPGWVMFKSPAPKRARPRARTKSTPNPRRRIGMR